MKIVPKKLTNDIVTPNKNPRFSTPSKQQQSTLDTGLPKSALQSTPSSLKTTNSTLKIDNQTVEISQKNVNKMYRVQQKKNKLCIISSNKTNKILSIPHNTFPNSKLCHCLSPNCGINMRINNIESKLTDYTMQHYCVILIGGDDFIPTQNYSELVFNIHDKLSTIIHTNVILCVPTFKYNDYCAMFNWRIEMLNYQLYHNIQVYDYAILFDFNLNLLYDYSMMTKQTGRLNNYGMRNIFDNLKMYLHNNSTDVNNNEFVSKIASDYNCVNDPLDNLFRQ